MKIFTTITRVALVCLLFLFSRTTTAQWISSGTATSTPLYTNGNVGIGAPSVPQFKLQVSSGENGNVRFAGSGIIGLSLYSYRGATEITDWRIETNRANNSTLLENGSFNISNCLNGCLPAFTILKSGKVGVGTTLANVSSSDPYKLYVKGGIRTDEVKVDIASSNNWADYVFEHSYNLRPLSQVESFIKENKHLPEIPSAKEVEANGINLGEMDALLLKKIEELTLYTIEINKKMEELKNENEVMKEKIKLLTN